MSLTKEHLEWLCGKPNRQISISYDIDMLAYRITVIDFDNYCFVQCLNEQEIHRAFTDIVELTIDRLIQKHERAGS